MSVSPKKNVVRLDGWVRGQILRGKQFGGTTALPATRGLGEKFGLSHATVHRCLRRLEKEGVLWRAANGRFYAAAAKRYVAPLRPMACSIRRLGGWSVLCREVMEGFSDVCAGRDTPILLVHSRELLAQKSSHAPVVLATPAVQTAILQDFLRVYAGKIGGLLLDEIWCDEAIASVRSELPGTVIFHKESAVREIGNVAADFEAGALMGLGHLFLCGYEHLVFVDLFGTYEPATLMLDRAQKALVQLGGGENTGILRSERGMNAFITGLSRSKQRVGFFCTDDYAALHLLEKLKAAKIAVPGRAGVLSTMGTHIAVENHLTTLSYDFPAMGAKAAEMLFQGQRGRTLFTPRLAVGETTG